MFFKILFYILLCCYDYCVANSNRLSIENSTGKYITYETDCGYNPDNIICKHELLCHIKVIDHSCTRIPPLQIQAEAHSVYMDLTWCDFVKVYSEANDLTIKLNDTYYAELNFDNSNNVNIHLIDVRYSNIYAQYAKNVNVLLSELSFFQRNVFYLNYVSNQIHFEIKSSHYVKDTIIATNANHFNLSIEDDSTFEGNVYCPYRSNNSCNFYIPTSDQIEGLNIYVSNMQLKTIRPLNIHFAKQSWFYRTDYTVWCQENKDTLMYESFTKISNQGTECANVTSECCYLNHLRENIFCPDDDNCTVNCNQTDCVNKNLYSSGLTNTLDVICTNKNCYHTIIYCPSRPNSFCNVSCDTDEYACYGTIIKYNTNNNNVNNFSCRYKGSCELMQIFVDDINKTQNILNYMHFSCKDCRQSAFIINTELEQVNIDCMDMDSCWDTQINGTLVQNMQINCQQQYACYSMTIFPKSDSVDAISIYCASPMYTKSCYWITIISAVFQHTLDYLSIADYSGDCSRISAISHYSGEESNFEQLMFIDNTYTNQCKCNLTSHKEHFRFRGNNVYDYTTKRDGTILYPMHSDLFSCPFSNSFNKIIECAHGEDCKIYLVDEITGTMIYANNANTLFVSFTNSSFVQMFADNVTTVSAKCLGRCEYIQLYGAFIETFNLTCDECFGLTIDVPHANMVNVNSYYMEYTEIYAINATFFSLQCNKYCWMTNLAISAGTDISIHCKRKCDHLLFYSNNGFSDLNNVTICDYTDLEDWTFYCTSPVLKVSSYYCEWKPRVGRTFCKCQYQLSNTMKINHIPFSEGCRTLNESSTYPSVQKIIGGMLCTIVFGIILYWTLIGVKLFLSLLCDFKGDKSWKELVLIEPPKKKILYSVHCCDLLIWITQIYIVIIYWNFYNYIHDVCDTIQDEPDIEDGEKVCTELLVCSWSQDECIVDASLYTWTILMSLTLPISIIFLFLTLICMIERKQTNVEFFSHFSCMYCCSFTDIEEHFLKRTLFKYDWIMLVMITIRYLIFFIPAFIIYASYIESNLFTIEWYDIFPILFLIFFNATIKQWYRMLPPYDQSNHVKYIINSVFGQHCGSIIYMFLDEHINEEKVALI